MRKMSNKDIQETTLTTSVSVAETVDEFIFTAVKPWCELVTETKISKDLLAQALIEYRLNHPEEFEQ